MEKAKTSAPSTTWALLFILLFFLKANGKSTTTTINGEISETRSVNGEEHGVDGDMNGAQYLLSRIEIDARGASVSPGPTIGSEEQLLPLFKKMLTLMEGETKRTIRLESYVKSLKFKAEVQAREMRNLKTKVCQLHSQNESILKQLTKLSERESTIDCGGCGCGNCSSVATKESIEMLQHSVEKIVSYMEKVDSKINSCCVQSVTTPSVTEVTKFVTTPAITEIPNVVTTAPTVETTNPHVQTTVPNKQGSTMMPNGRITTVSVVGAGENACEKNKLVAHLNDCTKYFHCTGRGIGVERECAEGSAFHPRLQVCDHPSLVPGCNTHIVWPKPEND